MALGLLRRLPHRWWALDTPVEHRGIRVFVYTGEEIGRSLYFLGSYEPEQEELLASLVAPGALLFDVGANVGVFTLLAAARGARVVAFEPSPRARRLLERGIAASGLGAMVTVSPLALADRPGACTFTEGRDGNWGVGRIFRADGDADHGPEVEVEATTLDAMARIHGRPTLLKMDIEGSEWLALQGAREVLSGVSAPTLLLEVHPEEIRQLGGSTEAVLALLESHGYLRHEVRHRSERRQHFYLFSKVSVAHPLLAGARGPA